MSKRIFFFSVLFSSILGAVLSAFIVLKYMEGSASQQSYNSIIERQKKVALTNYSDSVLTLPKGINFMTAAGKAITGVVHIRALYNDGMNSTNPLNGFFRNQTQSSGSGVIISDDGYVVTNNHVISNANEIEVVLNDNRSYYGKVIGTDPTTDLALLKIDAQDLKFIHYGNSDNVKHGQWVLAVGNPFDLNSTVTAGIISAKARNIGILRDKNNLQIESFIQTDAAVNPGNSGGALVNLKGELIGINTAIATPTGNYTGYSFAVPVSLVKKVIDDLLEFGKVQRGLLGIRIGDVDARLADLRDLNVVNGVFVTMVNSNSAAKEAGIEAGDVIVAINNKPTNNVSELQEMVARHRPGQEIEVTFIRDQVKNKVMATLKNFEGNIEVTRKTVDRTIEGAVFEEISIDELKTLKLKSGVRIISIEKGKWKKAGLKSGFIITKIDKLKVANVEDLHNILESKTGGLLVEGLNKNGERAVFGMDW